MLSTSAAFPARRSDRKVVFRAVVAALLFLLIAFLGFDVWFYRAVRASLPQRDGTVHLSGLTAPVTVTYDGRGVPNIDASNAADLFYAQGYITAQDRLWQMDMTRRYAAGELSVVLGPKYVKLDREQRIIGLRQVAEAVAAYMSAAQRAPFEAYAAGVNAYIAQHQKTLPLEFRFLTYFPHVWTVEDSVLVGLSMTEFLNHGLYKEELEKEKVLAKLGPELTADLFVNSSWRDHPPGAEGTSIPSEVPGGTTPEEEEEETAPEKNPKQPPRGPKSSRDGRSKGGTGAPPQISDVYSGPSTPAANSGLPARRMTEANPRDVFADTLSNPPEERLHPGSNNWVVSGAHTASGKPLLSNDMHLDLKIPNVWYEAHLTAGDFDVAGVTLPGVPFVIAGHNRYIAWGFTNLGPNVEDIYIERFNDKGEYLTPQGWAQPQHRQEIIRVKDKPEVALDVVVTRHGPIISDIVPGEKRKLALKWIIYDPRTFTAPFFAIDSAKNWQEFREAFSRLAAPGQNVVYADVDGHIGYQATGLVPVRAAGDGSVPVPGDDDSHEWTGYVPYDRMPSVYDPPSGIIATANGRVTPEGYPSTLSIEWGSPYRTERIYKLLNAKKKLAPADMLAIQTDIVSEFDRYCAQRFVYVVDHARKASRRAKAAADLMRDWDGAMTTDSAAPTVAYFSRRKLQELLLKPKLGDDWKQYHWFMSPVWLENVLAHQPQRWLPSGYANYDELLTAAVQAAVDDAGAPSALQAWRWGRVHRVDVKHPFWSHFPILKRAAGPGPQPLSGDGETVKQVSTHFGPSERLTVDFSDFDDSTLNIVNGQSGDIFDEHYNDQWNAYYHGTTFALPFSAESVRRAGVHHLRLEP
jgi:penicillin G amidase